MSSNGHNLLQLISNHVRSKQYHEALHLYLTVQDIIRPTHNLFLSLLKACACTASIKQGRYLHDRVIRNQFPCEGVLGNTLIDMYAKCGRLDDAHKAFNDLPNRSVVSWNAIISGYLLHGHTIMVTDLFDSMRQEFVKPSRATFLSILKAYATTIDIWRGRALHDQIIRDDLSSDMAVGSSIIDMYAKCGSLDEAQNVFNAMPNTDVVAWNALLAGYSQNGEAQIALECFQKMLQKGLKPTNTTFVCTLKACSSLTAIEEGMLIHDQIIKSSSEDEIVVSSLICMYASCKKLAEACKVFNNQAKQTLGVWSAIIAACIQNGSDFLALELFAEMPERLKPWDRVLYLSILKACGTLKLVVQGRMIHDQLMRNVKELDVILGSALVDMYCNCGALESARVVFDNLTDKNEVSWGAIIAGFSEHGQELLALDFYEDMQIEGISASRALILSALKACSILGDIVEGRLLHDQLVSTGHDSDALIESTLIDMYGKCGGTDEAVSCFHKIEDKDVVSWNAVMAACTQHGRDCLALELFERMLKEEEVEPDVVSILCVLQACSVLGSIAHGRLVHGLVTERNLSSNMMVGSNLVDMYARCGRLEEAQKVLHRLHIRDVVAWSSLIAGYAEAGDCGMARACLARMQEQGLKPDSNTFSSLLAACSHAGEVDEGYEYFQSMKQVHGITPTIEHFNCIIGLLAHSGRLEEAVKVIGSMPVSPDMTGWLSLIMASKNFGSFQVGRTSFDEVLRFDSNVGSGYVLMSNLCANMAM